MKRLATYRSIFLLAVLLLLAGRTFAAAPTAFQVQVTGKGQPIILIPGLTCPGAVWDHTVAHYKTQYQCHVLTLNGFGGTTATPATTSDQFLQTVRDELIQYIRDQHLQRPALVGHSLGGFVSLWVSSTAPELVGPLVIVDSLPFLAAVQNPFLTAEAAKPVADNLRQQMLHGQPLTLAQARQAASALVTDTAALSRVARWSAASNPATVAQGMYALYTTDLRQDIARIQQPVLVLGAWAAYQAQGATKESTRAIFAQQYAKLPQHRIELSEAGRHFLMYDDPTWFLAQTDAFLQQSYPAKGKRS